MSGPARAPRIAILVEDDCEISGHGLGNVAHLQYLPATFLMNTAAELGITVTFMVDVMQQLTFRRFAGQDAELGLQCRLWDETVRLMKGRGFDVQLHVHPQWRTARYVDGLFKVSPEWNLARWPGEDRRDMLRQCVGYLRELLADVDPSHRVVAFKAGSWGLQPSGPILRDCVREGLRLVMGPRAGMRFDDVGVDYRGLEEPTLPYHPDLDDIRRVSRTGDTGVIVLPLAPYAPSLLQVGQLLASKVQKRLTHGAEGRAYSPEVPAGWLAGQPVAGPGLTVREALRYATHLKLGDQPFAYLRRSFDDVLARVADTDAELVVLVVESHTKQFGGNFADIRRFLAYVVERRGHRVEFVDATRLLALLDDTPRLVRGADAR